MRIINTKTGDVLGSVITNQSLSLAQACELAGVDIEEHDIDHLHLSVYDEADEIEGAKDCARASVDAGLVNGRVPTYSTGDEEPIMHMVDHGWMMDSDADWLREKFGFVTRDMCNAYSLAWNERLSAAMAE